MEERKYWYSVEADANICTNKELQCTVIKHPQHYQLARESKDYFGDK